ncbi:MAG: hypothetical protein LT070_10235 [Solirubrobacteraceae bacterium]|nr:hypothetical protein [Solirubrobacteraceae bacterium]
MRDNRSAVQEVFPIVLYAVVGLALVVGLATLPGARRSYGEIGEGLLGAEPEPSGAGAAPVREVELRQLLEARNAVRTRAGRPLLDVDAELALLLGAPTAAEPAACDPAAAGPALESEVRDLVHARNARRARRGEPPLDVEAEVARQLGGLGGLT